MAPAGTGTPRKRATLPARRSISTRLATAEVARLFGDAFAGALATARAGTVAGADRVRVRRAPRPRAAAHRWQRAGFEEVRDAVRREWQSQARREANEAFYQKLRGRYRVVLEDAGGAPGGTAAASTR